MKTAVEWLADELKKNHGLQIDLYKEIEQAKEMEKEQIMDAFKCGKQPASYNLTSEQYYNETFKSE